MTHKLGIIVPYRKRPEQLQIFRNTIKTYLSDLDHELIVVDQVDELDFNRGKLLNIGFEKAEELGCDYVVFHDVDMLPIDADYSYRDNVTHLVGKLNTPPGFKRDNFDEYIGGVTLFPSNLFKLVNGFTNNYWGWGFEDDNLMLRLKEVGLQLGSKVTTQTARDGIGIELTGDNSYVAFPNILNNNRDFTIFINFSVDDIISDPKQITDNMSIFSIPGFDTSLVYNSFKTFNFQFWKKDLSSMSIPTDHYPLGTYSAAITIENRSDPKKCTLTINGEKIGELAYDKLNSINKAKFGYIGVGDPERDDRPNFLKGKVNSFAIFNRTLSDSQLTRLTTNIDESIYSLGLEDPSIYYDAKFIRGMELIDLSGNNNHGYCKNIKQVKTKISKEITTDIPLRENYKFKGLAHDENGYTNGYWVSWKSRENQLDHFNRERNKHTNFSSDGLSTLRYKLIKVTEQDNFHHLKVNLG